MLVYGSETLPIVELLHLLEGRLFGPVSPLLDGLLQCVGHHKLCTMLCCIGIHTIIELA